MKNRDVQLYGTAWLHPEIPFARKQVGCCDKVLTVHICQRQTLFVMNLRWHRGNGFIDHRPEEKHVVLISIPPPSSLK